MNPGEFLVLAFEEMQQDYHTAEFLKKYEKKGQKWSWMRAERRAWY